MQQRLIDPFSADDMFIVALKIRITPTASLTQSCIH